MSPFTAEESVTSTYVRGERLDAIINIVDATNLSRSLFFTTQLLELGIPVVVALNKSDLNEKRETRIDAEALAARLGCPVVQTVSTSAEGLTGLVSTAVSLVGKGQTPPYTDAMADLSSKEAAQAADRRRFAFVNEIVAEVRTAEPVPAALPA